MNKTALSDGDDNERDTLSENLRTRKRSFFYCRIHRSEGKSPSITRLCRIRNPGITVLSSNLFNP